MIKRRRAAVRMNIIYSVIAFAIRNGTTETSCSRWRKCDGIGWGSDRYLSRGMLIEPANGVSTKFMWPLRGGFV